MTNKFPEANNNIDFSDAVDTLLSEIWSESPQEKPTPQSKYQQILNKAIRWINLLRMKGLDVKVVANDFYERCRAEEPLLAKSGFFEEDRSMTIAKIQRMLTGISQLLEKRLPIELRNKGEAIFRIVWEDESAFGEWEGDISSSERYDLKSIIVNATQIFGEFSPLVSSFVTSRVLRELRSGTLSIPNFRRCESSDLMVTTFEWIPPGIQLSSSENEKNVDFEEYSSLDLLNLLPAEEELALWEEHPEMAKVFDRVLCSSVVQAYHVPIDT